jgi:hypothetical protein
MNLNEHLKKLEVVMKSIQQLDQNGMWDEVVSNIRNDEEDIDQIIPYAIETLKNWKKEDSNMEYDWLIGELKKIKV